MKSCKMLFVNVSVMPRQIPEEPYGSEQLNRLLICKKKSGLSVKQPTMNKELLMSKTANACPIYTVRCVNSQKATNYDGLLLHTTLNW